ncbi:MAG: hypothetical protein J7L95_00260 [Prolixibacteraceae bacterium]|nr:hypothetical protein [Prolixibacteraceae bacterium]
MEERKKESRYSRIYDQLSKLVVKSNSETARRATIIAVLHHKMDYFFWTGFYLIETGGSREPVLNSLTVTSKIRLLIESILFPYCPVSFYKRFKPQRRAFDKSA